MEYLTTTIEGENISYALKSVANPVQTIVFIHGFPFDKSIWDDQLTSLSENFQGIAYDVRGFGESTTQHTFLSIDLFAKDLLAFLKSQSIESYILCGISMGGYIALRAYELAPESIKGLVLCDTNAVADGNEAKLKRLKSIQQVEDGGKEEFTESFIENVFSTSTLANKPGVVNFLRSVILNTSDETVCATLLAMASRTDTSHVLAEINVPVLIIRGEEDKLMSQEQTNQLTNHIEKSEFVSIKHSGHLPNLENTQDFNDALGSFLSKNFHS